MINFLQRYKKRRDEVPGMDIPEIEGEPEYLYDGEVVQGIRQLISRLNMKGGLPRSLAMIAALRQEGVSYLSQVLAATIANDLGHRVCLLELNYWWPNPEFQFEEDQGSLAAVIDKRMKLDRAIID